MIILLFGAKKLPDMARSIGRSAKILKAETKGLRSEDDPQQTAQPGATTAQQMPAAQQLPPAQPQVAQPPVQQPAVQPVQPVQPQVAQPQVAQPQVAQPIEQSQQNLENKQNSN
ncbi:twin-arginine translocase TatA/TatE family subunit [Saccharothrix isguenensis]